MSIQALYEKDFFGWISCNINALQESDFKKVDIKHLIEVLEEMSRREKREIINRLAVLFCHLLKWEFQPGNRCGSWLSTLEEERYHIEDLLNESPSLKTKISEEDFKKAYQNGRRKAFIETGIDINKFPEKSQFLNIKELLKKYPWPQNIN